MKTYKTFSNYKEIEKTISNLVEIFTEHNKADYEIDKQLLKEFYALTKIDNSINFCMYIRRCGTDAVYAGKKESGFENLERLKRKDVRNVINVKKIENLFVMEIETK